MRTVTIIGVGRVGGAFALSLARSGYQIETLVSRDPSALAQFNNGSFAGARMIKPGELTRIESDLVLITTRDDQIRPVAERLAALEASKTEKYAFHCSGALSSEELAPLAGDGWRTGSLHPLVSISDPVRGSEALKSAYFAIEGDPDAVKAAQSLVNRLGGSHFEVPTPFKPLYHAAAVVACGHLVALLDVSQRMLEACGIGQDVSREVLYPLISSTVANLADSDPAKALTGPFARADVDTIRGHIKMLLDLDDPDLIAVYRLLGSISVDLARRQGGDEEKLNEILQIILLDKNTSE